MTPRDQDGRGWAPRGESREKSSRGRRGNIRDRKGRDRARRRNNKNNIYRNFQIE